MRQVKKNLETALSIVGATLDDVVRTTTFVTDFEVFFQAIDVRDEIIGKSLPTSTAVQLLALAYPGYMVEIDATAMLA